METVESILDLQPRRLSSAFSAVGASPVASVDPSLPKGVTASDAGGHEGASIAQGNTADNGAHENALTSPFGPSCAVSPITPHGQDAEEPAIQNSGKLPSAIVFRSPDQLQGELDWESHHVVTPPVNRQQIQFLQHSTAESVPSPPSAPRKVREHVRPLIDGVEPMRPILFDETWPRTKSKLVDRGESIQHDPPLPVEQSNSGGPSAGNEDDSNFLIAERSKLIYTSIPSPTGFVKVAIGLFSNSMFAGVLRVDPRTSTGVRCALRADEMYFISRGNLELDIGCRRFLLSEGDFFAVLHHTSFEIRNPAIKEAIVVCFSQAYE